MERMAEIIGNELKGMDADRFEVLKLLTSSVMPLGILTVVVLAVILFGITTATESAAVGAAGAFILAFHARTATLRLPAAWPWAQALADAFRKLKTLPAPA